MVSLETFSVCTRRVEERTSANYRGVTRVLFHVRPGVLDPNQPNTPGPGSTVGME